MSAKFPTGGSRTFFSSKSKSSSFFHKDNKVMFSISNNMIKLLKELPRTDLINMCYSKEMCVTLVIFVLLQEGITKHIVWK